MLYVDNAFLFRFVWYLYYVPMIFSPFIMLGLTSYIFIKKKKVYYIFLGILFAINLIFLLIVLTNDLSEFVFVFDKTKPEDTWSKLGNYTRTWVYYVIMVIIIMELLLSGIIIGYFTRKKKMYFALIIYSLCLIFIIIYGILYILNIKIFNYLSDMVVVYISLGFIIMFISTKYGLFISSGDYETFFNNCVFPLRIDTKNNELFENKSYQLRNKKINFKEKVSTIGENKFIVLEDVSKLEEYNALLHKQLDDIISNNDILEKEKKFKKHLEVDYSKKIINERVEKNIDKDVAKINKLVYSLNDNFDKNNKDLQEILQKIALLCTYVKRKTYLILMQESNEAFTRESVLVFTKEVLTEMKSKVKNFEVSVTGFTNIPVFMVLDFVNFLYSLVDNLESSCSLFVIYSYKNDDYLFKVGLIDYKGKTESFKKINSDRLKWELEKDGEAYVFALMENKNV